MTLSADEVKKSIAKHRATLSKETRDFRKKQAEQEAYHDLRDDVCAIVKNSGKSLEDIHAECGPVPATITAWMNREVSQPRMGKLRSVLKICGYDLGIIDGDGNAIKKVDKRGTPQ